MRFTGNQVRWVGRVGRTGGRADVFVDGTKQLVPVDCFGPITLHNEQILYYVNGLAKGPHELKIVVRGERNPAAQGDDVFVDGIQYSAATGESGFGEGGGPTGFQRMIFGYPGRVEFRDSQGRSLAIRYRVYGAHWRNDRLGGKDMVDGAAGSFCEENSRPGTLPVWGPLGGLHGESDGSSRKLSRPSEVCRNSIRCGPGQRGITIYINGQKMTEGLDVWKTAGGINKAADVVYNDVRPQNGIVAIRLVGSKVNDCQRDAMIQALEIGPSEGGPASTPKTISALHTDENPEQNRIVYIQGEQYSPIMTDAASVSTFW